MIDFENLKKRCQELPELKTLEAAQKKEEGVLKKLQDAGVEINKLRTEIEVKEAASIAALLDDSDGVNAIRKESARLKEKLGDATYWRARIQAEALPTVRRELAAAERAYKASVKTLVLESAKQMATDITNVVESLYKMYLCWNEGLKNLSGSTGIGFPEHEFTIRIETELRDRLGRKQCADCQPFIEHISKELQRATVLWNQMGALSQKKAIPEEPAEPAAETKPEIISSTDAAYLTAK